MNTLTLNKVLLNAIPLNIRKRLVKDKDFIYKVLDREFTFSVTAGGRNIKDGSARIEAIKGNSLVWNQQVDYENPSAIGASTVTKENGELVLNFTEGGSPNAIKFLSAAFVKGHRILPIIQYESALDGTSIYIKFGSSVLVGGAGTTRLFKDLNKPITLDQTSLSQDGAVWIWVYEPTTIRIKSLRIHDLTQMFGAGNEPTTIEEFNARKPIVEDEYAHKEGEVIHCNAEGIKSVGRNLLNLEREKAVYDTLVITPTSKSHNFSEEKWINGISTNGNINKNNEGDFHIEPNRVWGTQANISYGVGFPIRVIGGQTYCISYTSTKGSIHVTMYDKESNVLTYNLVSTGGLKVIPNNAYWMVVVCMNASDTSLDISNICINLSDPDFNGQYEPYWEDTEDLSVIPTLFPDGMKSAGSAHDTIYYDRYQNKWFKVTRIGSVDMGDLDIRLTAEAAVFFSTIPNMKLPTTITERADGLLCEKYIISKSLAVADMPDKSILRFPSNRIYIKDSAYTDAASFKAAMAGVILYYELADPIVEEITIPMNPTYKVDNGGTERMIAEQPSAPISAEIGYYILKNNLELTLNS